MSKFIIDKSEKKSDTVSRTIRFGGNIYDRLVELSDETGVTFNKLVNQCIFYALENLDEEASCKRRLSND